MAGIGALSRIQMGVEATAGESTGVPTTYWRGTGFLKDNRKVVFPRENIGILGDVNRTYIPSVESELVLEAVASFEQLCYILNAGVKTAAPTTDASSAQIRTWAVQNTDTDPIATTDLSTMIFEGGDNNQAELMRFGFCSEFNLSGKFGEGLMVSANFLGRTIGTTTFTSGLSIPTVEEILFGNGALYIDPTSDTPGTTQKTNTLLEMNLRHKTGWKGQMTADGRLDFSFIKRVSDEIVLDLTFEHDATAVAEKAFWRAETARLIQLKFAGSALSTTNVSASYDTKVLVANLYGSWENFDALKTQDGNNIVTGRFRAAYDTTAGAKATYIIANETASLP